MEQASAWHCRVVPWVATHLRLGGNFTFQCKTLQAKKTQTTGHDGKGERKPQTQNSGHKKPRANHSGRYNGRFQFMLVDKGF